MFAGKHIVITGAGNGIGKCLSEQLLDLGAVVSAIDIDSEKLSTLESNAKKHGHELKGFKANVTSVDEMTKALAEAVAWKGPVGVWVNNAGVSGLGDFMKHSLEDFDKTVNINLRGVVIGTRLALEHMEPLGSGTIVNMASVAGHFGAAYLTAYCASKFAVVGFSQALRSELRTREVPVRICVVSPGFVDTNMIERGKEDGFPEWLSWMLSKPESVAKEIIDGIRKGKEDIFPTLNGRMLIRMSRVFPVVARRGSHILLTKSVKDLILYRKTPPKN